MLAAENYLYIILRSHLPLLHLFFVLFIKLIADKVAPQRTHMYANLMGTAGLQIALYQAGQRLKNLQGFVIGNCVFAVFLHNRHFLRSYGLRPISVSILPFVGFGTPKTKA